MNNCISRIRPLVVVKGYKKELYVYVYNNE